MSQLLQLQHIFLKWFFRLLYNRFAWSYDVVAWTVSIGRWKSWVLSMMPLLTGERILELGHGPGHLQVALKGKGIFVAGVDASWQMSTLACRNMLRKGLEPELVHGYAQKLPFSRGSFDQVVATFPSEYIIEPATLEEIHRVLQPRGSLIVLPVAWITGKSLFDRAAALLFRITGQTPDTHTGDLQKLELPGFDLKTEMRHTESSRLLIVIATKVDQ